MKIHLLVSSSVLLLVLGACQSIDQKKDKPTDATLAVLPVEDVRHSTARPEALYSIGRYFQGQARYEQAISAYQRLLADQPNHVEARNALGLIYAAQGRHVAAIAEFKTALSHAPDAAAIHNNLGYAYLLNDNISEAIATLTTAQALSPSNQRVLDNLDAALARGGSMNIAATTNPPDTAEPAAAPTTATAVPAGTEETVKTPVADSKSMRLEISNANGVSGLARDTSRQLAAAGYAKPRLTNEPPYQQPATVIQYRPGFEQHARQLRTDTGGSVPTAAARGLRSDINVRLVLGKDFRAAAMPSGGGQTL